MKALFIVSLISLCLSFVAELIFNLIIMPVKKEMERDSEGPIEANELKTYYQMNKPEILRQINFLNLLIERGGFLFFILFSILFLIAAYLSKISILWVLLCIPGLIFLFFILNMITALLSRVFVR